VKALLASLKGLGPARLAALSAVGFGVLGLLGFLAWRSGADQMALLYADLDLRESAQVADQLARQHIPYRLAAEGAQILVPENQVAQARVQLAKEGLPTGGSIGYEIFDRGDGLTVSQFQQQINQARALEGELSRTIRAIQGVRAARVHLVLPKREPFARERQEAQASVLLTMAGFSRLDREGIQAVLNLVSAAVPGLKPQNVSIIDSRGGMLARAGEPAGPAAAAASTEEIRRATETRLARAVEEMLEHSVGAGHVRAEAAVDVDFDRVNETQEKYDPDGQVVRSSQTVNSNSRTTEASNTVSVQNNLPNADAGKEGTAGSQDGRQEETTNYEIGKTVRTLIHEQPQIRRINLAVMIDGVETDGPDGKPQWSPRPGEELARIASLVRTAVGYNEQRGDHVEIVSMRFAVPDVSPVQGSDGVLGLALGRADMLRLVQTALFGAVAVMALFFVLRPMALRLTAFPERTALDGPADASLLGAPSGPAALPSSDAPPVEGAGALLDDQSMINIASVNGQLRASSIRRIAALVGNYPEASLTIVRGWMLQEAD
jgi:flagellar M-ring protein FliF